MNKERPLELLFLALLIAPVSLSSLNTQSFRKPYICAVNSQQPTNTVQCGKSIYVLDFGKYIGSSLASVPRSYIDWVIKARIYEGKDQLTKALNSLGYLQISTTPSSQQYRTDLDLGRCSETCGKSISPQHTQLGHMKHIDSSTGNCGNHANNSYLLRNPLSPDADHNTKLCRNTSSSGCWCGQSKTLAASSTLSQRPSEPHKTVANSHAFPARSPPTSEFICGSQNFSSDDSQTPPSRKQACQSPAQQSRAAAAPPTPQKPTAWRPAPPPPWPAAVSTPAKRRAGPRLHSPPAGEPSPPPAKRSPAARSPSPKSCKAAAAAAAAHASPPASAEKGHPCADTAGGGRGGTGWRRSTLEEFFPRARPTASLTGHRSHRASQVPGPPSASTRPQLPRPAMQAQPGGLTQSGQRPPPPPLRPRPPIRPRSGGSARARA